MYDELCIAIRLQAFVEKYRHTKVAKIMIGMPDASLWYVDALANLYAEQASRRNYPTDGWFADAKLQRYERSYCANVEIEVKNFWAEGRPCYAEKKMAERYSKNIADLIL